MVVITIKEQKQYFKEFKCEALSAKNKNRLDIMNFEATEDGKRLEQYLKKEAWEDDLQGETRVFLIKDLDDNIALFFLACFSAIEIHHFCKNKNFIINDSVEVPIGFGLFWEQIVPHIIKITELIGSKYLYLFAADNTESGDVKKLVRYYKSALRFTEVEDVNVIKPEYDKNCYGLLQEISDLKQNQDSVWEAFSDL